MRYKATYTGGIELRKHANAALGRILDYFLDVSVRIHVRGRVCACLRHSRERDTLEGKRVRVNQMLRMSHSVSHSNQHDSQ